jgi:hypothetical protein
VAYQPIKDPINNRSIIVPNGTELVIKAIEPGIIQIDISGETYRYTAHNLVFEDIPGIFPVVASEDSGQFELDLEGLKNKAKKSKNKSDWGKFYRLMESSAPISHVHAQTVHKSQGSTYQHTFVLESDLNLSCDLDLQPKLWYVALSRAKQSVTV